MEFAVEEGADVDPPVAPFEPALAVYRVVLEVAAEDAQVHVEGAFALLLAVFILPSSMRYC